MLLAYLYPASFETSRSWQAVYRILREAEHRSTSIIPYWKVGAQLLYYSHFDVVPVLHVL